VHAFLYTWSTCAFCKRAKELLDRNGVPWREKVLDGDRELAERIATRFGRRTMPFVLLDGEPVGGLEELEALEREGALG
jgi:glutaredoxin 3